MLTEMPSWRLFEKIRFVTQLLYHAQVFSVNQPFYKSPWLRFTLSNMQDVSCKIFSINKEEFLYLGEGKNTDQYDCIRLQSLTKYSTYLT